MFPNRSVKSEGCCLANEEILLLCLSLIYFTGPVGLQPVVPGNIVD